MKARHIEINSTFEYIRCTEKDLLSRGAYNIHALTARGFYFFTSTRAALLTFIGTVLSDKNKYKVPFIILFNKVKYVKH